MALLDIVGLLCLLGCLALISCASRIGFEPPPDPPGPQPEEMEVKITPMWNTSARPGQLSAYFYSMVGDLSGIYALPNEGGAVVVPVANYRVILFNADARQVVYSRTEHFEHASVRVGAEGSKAEEAQLLGNPGGLFSTSFEVSPAIREISSLLGSRSIGVTVRIQAEDHSLAQALALSVRLRNVADGVNLSTGKAYHTTHSGVNLSSLSGSDPVGGVYTFTGTAFGCCMADGCQNPESHAVFSDIAIEAPDGTTRTVSVDVSDALKSAQESVTEVSIEVTLAKLAASAVVTGWETGAASGGLEGVVR